MRVLGPIREQSLVNSPITAGPYLNACRDAHGGENQGADAYYRRQNSFPRPIGSFQHGLHSLRTRVAEQAAQDLNDFALPCLSTKHETRNRDRDNNPRPD